jgi:hypothetical protein
MAPKTPSTNPSTKTAQARQLADLEAKLATTHAPNERETLHVQIADAKAKIAAAE